MIEKLRVCSIRLAAAAVDDPCPPEPVVEHPPDLCYLSVAERVERHGARGNPEDAREESMREAARECVEVEHVAEHDECEVRRESRDDAAGKAMEERPVERARQMCAEIAPKDEPEPEYVSDHPDGVREREHEHLRAGHTLDTEQVF